ncbi:hypothetical protein [Pseudanabaena sp. 'Roaring Creek']|uniref:hypothetical protein n=1 Tax=Pseudanabaena sp. 'Roaring Creek' TaxID=1681830 RepID=UPI0006D7A8BC|nr:hypothetical protein [Pseudanabaena sp. 'Roaring Creek']
MPKPIIPLLVENIEKIIDIISPEIPKLPEIPIEEEWQIFYARSRKTKISIIENSIIEIKCDYEAIASIICDRLIQNGAALFNKMGIIEIHIFYHSSIPATKIYIN